MLRRLYRCSVGLHPASFRKRFGDEMLYIFDQQKGSLAKLGVVMDSFLSLFRQWLLRPTLGNGLPASSGSHATTDSAPSFMSLAEFRPRTSAIVNGTVLSLLLFCMTCFAIRYSWIHVLHLHIREIGFDANEQNERSSLIVKHLQFDVLPIEAEDATRTESVISHGQSSSGLPARVRPTMIWLDVYVGKYVSESPPTKISIQIENDHLSLRVAGESGLALSPMSQTRFAIAGAENAWVDFIPDGRGGVRGLSLIAGGHILTAQRQ